METEIRNPFTPGTGIDMVFNLDSLTPTIRSSIIFENDEQENRLIIAQPTPVILPSFRFGKLHITTLVKDDRGGKSRLGVPCRIVKFMDDYRMSRDNRVPSILVEFTPPVLETNIRAAFRLSPNPTFNIVGKFIWNGVSYISGTDFKLHDISITGIGLIVPSKVKNKRNPLRELKYGTVLKIGIALLADGETPSTFTTRVTVARVNPNHGDQTSFVGLKFHNLEREVELLLGKFIHEAQLHGIRQISGL